MRTIHAIYERGVFRPTVPVALPEGCEVEFEPQVIGPSDAPDHLERVFRLLCRRHNSDRHEVAERHNEHQP